MKMYNPNVTQNRQSLSRVMIVQGSSSLFVEPDTASIQVEIVTENKQLSQAYQENSYKMNEVVQALLQAGITRENMQTTAYTIRPVYDYVDGIQIFRTYQVSTSMEITIKDIYEASRVIEVAVDSGVTHVSNIQFRLENHEGYYQQALSNALRNAEAKAEEIAETLNVRFDSIPKKIIEEKREGPQLFRAFAATDASVQAAIQPGKTEIRAGVEVEYRY
ncbi:SIMPL domain-containing protein [Salipaludibacillus sp. HK11]|uniref:SIMPL domain-containing protein n=1 Tax=Salipaludibacillus sp. HK11 TaxID=3394320 RepID=UPI0039FC6E33